MRGARNAIVRVDGEIILTFFEFESSLDTVDGDFKELLFISD
jgi:hypothetical protein